MHPPDQQKHQEQEAGEAGEAALAECTRAARGIRGLKGNVGVNRHRRPAWAAPGSCSASHGPVQGTPHLGSLRVQDLSVVLEKEGMFPPVLETKCGMCPLVLISPVMTMTGTDRWGWSGFFREFQNFNRLGLRNPLQILSQL